MVRNFLEIKNPGNYFLDIKIFKTNFLMILRKSLTPSSLAERL